jgi:heme A synthase
VTRFQKLTLVAIVFTFALVTVGVLTRAMQAGLGCPDWPLCYGQVLPPLDDYKAWLEWIHRTIAAVLGLLILGVAALAFIDHRDRRPLLWPSIGAVALVGFQAWLGRETVRLGNSGESVTAHLAAAMVLFALLVYLFVRAGYPARLTGRGASQRFAALATFSAVSVYALLLFGSHVTATGGALVFPDWPLMGGTGFPPLTDLTTAHVLHRYVAGLVGVIVVITAIVAWRTQRAHPTVIRLATWAALLILVQAMLGALQVWTKLAAWTQVSHVAFGAAVWGLAFGAAVHAHYAARTAGMRVPPGGDPAFGGMRSTRPSAAPPPRARPAWAPGRWPRRSSTPRPTRWPSPDRSVMCSSRSRPKRPPSPPRTAMPRRSRSPSRPCGPRRGGTSSARTSP